MLRVVEAPEVVLWSPEDLFGVASHWTIAQGRQWWRPAQTELSASFAMEEEDQVVAVAGGFLPELHTRRLWAFVEVVPALRRRGIGARAVAELRSRLPLGSRLRTKVEPDSPADWFARRQGLRPLQHTRTVRVVLDAVGDRDGVGRFSVNSAPEEVVDAWRRYYVSGHAWDPPSEQPLAFWRQALGSADDTVLTWPSRPPFRALAIVGPGGEWTGGCIDRDDPEAVTLVTRLLAAAADSSSPTLEIELDDWMHEVHEVLRPLRTEVLDRAVILAE